VGTSSVLPEPRRVAASVEEDEGHADDRKPESPELPPPSRRNSRNVDAKDCGVAKHLRNFPLTSGCVGRR